MTNVADIVEGCRSYPDEPWALLLENLVTDMALSPRQVYTLSVARFLATLRVQNKTTSDAGIEKWGFSELLHRLSEVPEKEILRVEEFDERTFAVRCVFNSDRPTLLGCTIVSKRPNVMKTPPAWDGSIGALERFNSPPEE
jgi:hypothetical protein